MIRKSLKIRLELLFIVLSNIAQCLVLSRHTISANNCTFLPFSLQRADHWTWAPRVVGSISSVLVISGSQSIWGLCTPVHSWWFIPILTPCKVLLQFSCILFRDKRNSQLFKVAAFSRSRKRGSHSYKNAPTGMHTLQGYRQIGS